MEVWSRVLFDNISNIITHPLKMWSIDYYKKCTVLYVATQCFFIIDGDNREVFILEIGCTFDHSLDEAFSRRVKC